MVKTLPSNAWGAISIPGLGNKILHASWPKCQNMKQKQYCNKSKKTLKMVHIKKNNNKVKCIKFYVVCICMFLLTWLITKKGNKKYAYCDNILNHFDKILPQSLMFSGCFDELLEGQGTLSLSFESPRHPGHCLPSNRSQPSRVKLKCPSYRPHPVQTTTAIIF